MNDPDVTIVPRLGQPRDGLRHFGRVVAATSHELVNVLNIVGELAGLQEDLLRGMAAGEEVDVARIAQLADRIRSQVERGDRILHHLNRFGHMVDRPVVRYDVGEAVDHVAGLAQRFARLARVTLTVVPAASDVSVVGSPFAAAVAVLMCLDAQFAAGDGELTVTVRVAPRPSGAEIRIERSAPVVESAWAGIVPHELEAAVAACPGELVQTPSREDPCRFVLALRHAAEAPAESMEGADAP